VNTPRIRNCLVLALALVTLMLAFARPANAEVIGPAINLGPTIVANGVATISGTVGVPMSGASLSINGQPLSINAAGQFNGVVNLAGHSSLDLAVTNPLTGEITRTTIPLTSNIIGPGGLVSPTVLSALGQAAAEITKPVGGFVILDQVPLTIGGSVLNKGELASMKVNGTDVLGLTGPGGAFTIPIPGTSREFTIMMTDKQGVTHTTTYPVTQQSSVIQTPLGRSVSAAGALGIKITSVRYLTALVRSKKRFRVVVTVKDKRGYRIRDATVTLKSQRPRLTVGETRAKLSNKVGQVSFVMRVRPRALGKRLFVLASARTPSAKAQRKTVVRLPQNAQRRPARRS
jgi:hypothetical protein